MNFAKYLPIEAVQKIWGLHVIDNGFSIIAPDSPYPPLSDHPQEYYFVNNAGRILHEYQIVYISDGKGSYRSETAGSYDITGGMILLIFPDEWHTYSPNSNTGWEEYWIGFNGSYAENLMKNLFSLKRPVINIGFNSELLRMMQEVLNISETLPYGYRELLSGYTIAIISHISAGSFVQNNKRFKYHDSLEKARNYIFKHANEDIDFLYLADRLNMSYSSLRILFKRETGLALKQFQLEIRLNQAKEILQHQDLTIAEIAERLGFSSGFYFSRLFKKKIGVSPLNYIKQQKF